MYIFFKRVTLKSPLAAKEVLRRLKAVTTSVHKPSPHRGRFTGIVQTQEFRIMPAFDYRSVYRIRPEIAGRVNEMEEGFTRISLIFRLPLGAKVLLLSGLILNLAVIGYLMVAPVENEFILRWQVLAILIPIMFVIFLSEFMYKSNIVLRVLKHKFKAIG